MESPFDTPTDSPRSFAPAGFRGAAGPSRSPEREGWIGRLRKLGDPRAPAGEGPHDGKPALEIVSTQGAPAELRAAALRALSLHVRGGIPLEEIAIVARSLEPYAPFLETTFGGLGIPFTSSASSTLARDAGAFLALLGVLAKDFERGAVMDLLRRPAFASPPSTADVDRWDRLSRTARIVSGISDWRDLPDCAERLPPESSDVEKARARREENVRSAARLVDLLDALERERGRWRETKTFEEHGAFLRDLARKHLKPSDSAQGIERIIRAIEAAGKVRQAALGDSRKEPAVSMEDVEQLARTAAEMEDVPIRGEDAGGCASSMSCRLAVSGTRR